MDFGLARSADMPQLTEEGAIVGTLSYLAPEVIEGQSASIQSDLYALGVVLYELTTSRPPFSGDTVMAVLSQHLHAAVTSPSAHNAEIPAWLDEVILRLLSKQPEERPASAGEVLNILVERQYVASRPTPAGNLPMHLSKFIGREKEISQVKARLAQARLVTLTGPGGIGKTRLSLQVAQEVLPKYPNGVWLVELASLADPALVPQTVATALGTQFDSSRPLLAALTDYLRERSLLLVLDNCEHLIDACAQLAEHLLHNCPAVRLLASSREALGLDGEFAVRVPSLSLPEAHATSLELLQHSEAVQLFVERATAGLPGFILTEANAPAVAQVCRRLDGIALALELAAARVKLLKVEQIAARLDDAFRLLTGGSRTALPRQQTLRATIEWSYNLLPEAERSLLRRLSVFAGGWTLEAAEVVCAGEGIEAYEVLDLLTQLVNKSLVVVEREQGVEAWHRLLETVRQYAREKLVEVGEGEQVRARHLNACLQFAETVALQLYGPEQVLWLQRMESDHDNLRAALGWAIVQGESAAALRLSGALGWFWFVRGHLSEGRQWFEQALALSRRATNVAGMSSDYRGWYAKALQAAGKLAEAQGDYATTQALNEESLALFRELGDKPAIALSLHWLGAAAFGQGDYAATQALHEETLALYRELGDKGGIGFSLNWLGMVASNQGDFTAARTLHEESLALFRELGDKRNIAISLGFLGVVAFGQGDYAAARALHKESLVLFQKLEDKKGIAECLPGLAAVAQADQQPQRATKLLGAVEALLDRIGAYLDPTERADFDRTLAAARAQLDETMFNAAWAAGHALTLEQAVAYGLEEISS